MMETSRHLRAGKPFPTRRTVVLAAAVAVGAAFPDWPLGTASGPAPEAHIGDVLREDPLASDEGPSMVTVSGKPALPLRTEIVGTFAARTPRYWGLEAPGVLARLPQGSPGIALTIDYCGGPGGNGCDQALLAALHERRIPATLFLNSRWITANPAITSQLAADPLFELANHGTTHQPLSTTGKSAYGINGTQNAGEIYDEVMANDANLTQLAGTRPRFFRPGTAHLDDVAADIVRALGLTPAGFSINGDGGATYPAATVARETSKARPGDIIICHGNHPLSGTAEGIAHALDDLAARGARLVPLP